MNLKDKWNARMKKNGLSGKKLTQAVLASTLIVSQCSYADNYSTVVGAQVMSAQTDDQVTVTPTGQINTNVALANGILIDEDAASVTLQANNTLPGSNAIVTTGAALNGILVGNGTAGASATIVTGANANISSMADGILISDDSANIDNSGTITGTLSGIESSNAGTNTTLTNEATGSIIGTSAPGLLVAGPNLTLNNSGVITSGVGFDAFRINASTSAVNNNSGGNIFSTANGINVQAISGNIQNSGTITTSGGPGLGAILIGSVYNGTITNNAAAIIQATDTTAPGGNAILIKAPFSLITNSGTIQSVAGDAIAVTAASAGTIQNNSLIQSNTGNAISLAGNITGINNTLSGTITSTNPSKAVIVVTQPNVTLASGIINSGIIKNQTAGGTAIDLQTAGANINVPLTQNAGTITGNVLLDSAGGNAFTMNGGTIAGAVTAGNVANTININAGTITNTLTLGNGGDTLNLTGGSLQAIMGGAGNDIFNFSGATFTSLNGGAGNDTLNINGSLTTAGPITSVETITVNNAGTGFVVNNPIIGLDTLLNLMAGTSTVVNAPVAGLGGLLNNGMLTISNNQTVALAGNAVNNGTVEVGVGAKLSVNSFTQPAGGNYAVEIQNGKNGIIDVGAGGANLAAKSTISPTLIAGQFIPAGTAFDIVQAFGSTITSKATVVQPSSVVYSFTPQLVAGNTILELVTKRNTYTSLAPNQPLSGVAGALDAIVAQGPTNPDIINLLGQLDYLTSQQDLQTALSSLIPSVNYALIMATRVGWDNAFSTIQRKIEDMHGLHYSWQTQESGYNYGDPCSARGGCPPYREPIYNGSCKENCYPNLEPLNVNPDLPPPIGGSTWGAVYGSIIYQNERLGYDGYDLNARGYGFGTDYDISDYVTVGIAFNSTNATANPKSTVQQQEKVNSYQGTFYWQYEPFEFAYIDGMIGAASHSYKTSRAISIGALNAAASGAFRGFQYGTQFDLGYLVSNEGFFVVPIARFRYTRLEINSYTEEGAGGLDLAVTRDDLDELVGAVGLRLAFKRDFADATYVPEASFLLSYDFRADGQNLVTNFVGQGPSFTTIGIQPARTAYILGLGVNVHSSDRFIFKVKWEIESRDQLLGNTGLLQLWYRFDQV